MAKTPTLVSISSGYNLASIYGANNTAIINAFTNTLSRDGSSPNQMNADLDMNSKKITHVANGTASTDAINLGQVQSAAANGITSITGGEGLAGGGMSGVLVINSPAYIRTAAEISLGVTPVSYNYLPGDVRRYGAVGDGATMDTVAIQTAINVAGANNTVTIPDTGISYKTGPLSVSAASGVRIVGTGRRGTTLLFVPTGNQSDVIGAGTDQGTCIQFACNSGASQQSQCSLENLSIACVTNYTYNKNAIRLVNTSQFFLENVSITSFWGGPSFSCGLRIMGHESLVVRNFYSNCSIPIRISSDPGPGSISVDHFQFTNCYLLGPSSDTSSFTSGIGGGKSVDFASCCVLIDDGVRVAQMNWDGYQGWVLAREGLHWVAPTSPGDTQFSVRFANVRKEQSYGTLNKIFNIQCNGTFPLQNIVFENCGSGEVNSTHYYLRNVENASILGGGLIGAATAMVANNYIVDMATNCKSLSITDVRAPVGANTFLLAGFADNTAAVAGGRVKSTHTWPTTATWLI